MKKEKSTAGQRMIESARQALAFVEGREDHGCVVHVPDEIDVKAIREKISLSQGEFARLFGLSKRTLEHWEHGRRFRLDRHAPSSRLLPVSQTQLGEPCSPTKARAENGRSYCSALIRSPIREIF
jgi:putative transcriptional regulator